MRGQKLKKRIVTTLVGCVLVATTVVAAQPHGRRGSRGGDRGRGPGSIFRELDLSEDQRQQMRSLFEQSSSQETMTRLSTARQTLNEAVEAGTDEGTIRQHAYDLGMAEGDAAVERAQVHAAVMQILTPDQRTQYEQVKAEQKQEMEERRQRFEERRQKRGNRQQPDPDSFSF